MDHFQLFEKVTGRVSLKRGKVLEAEIKDACSRTGAQYHEAADEILITGTWEQVSGARSIICSRSRGGRKRKSSSSSDYSEGASTNPDGQVFDTVPHIVKYMKTFFDDKLKSIEQSYQVKIIWSRDLTKVHITAQPTGSYSDLIYNHACDQFASLYRRYHQTVTSMKFNVSRDGAGYSNHDLKTALCAVTRNIPNLIVEKSADDTLYTVWGTKSSLDQANQWIRGQLGVTVMKARSVTPNSPPKDALTHETANKLKVVVCQGDITKENVDIIVNACNKHLDHAGGVSYAISKAGGPTIQQESEDFVTKNGSLRTGDVAVTSPGFLHCKHVVHAVGPRWNKHGKEGCTKIFRKVFMNVYQAAVKVGAKSIAMPAISSGIYGVPKEVCAEATFSFVDEIDQKLASDPTARPFEIRLVNIDGEIAQAFGDEYKKWLFKGRKLERRHSFNAFKNKDDPKSDERKSVDDLHKTPRLKAPLRSVLKTTQSSAKSDPSLSATYTTSRNHHMSTGASGISKSNKGVAVTSVTSSVVNRYTGLSGTSRTAYGSIGTSAFSVSSSSKGVISNQSKPTTSRSGDTHSYTTGIHSQHGAVPLVGQSGDRLISKSGSTTTVRYVQNGVGSSSPLIGNGSNDCSICYSPFTDPKCLAKCGHTFCRSCIDTAFKYQKKCPVCQEVYGVLEGDQPDGTMEIKYYPDSLPGYEGCGCYVITYVIPSGCQDQRHPKPGQKFAGTKRQAFLPATKEGKVVLKMLQKAFDRKLIFTIGRSNTTGKEDCVTWNDIHHKTSIRGGPQAFGYPDQDYLNRVKDELKAKGIVPEWGHEDELCLFTVCAS